MKIYTFSNISKHGDSAGMGDPSWCMGRTRSSYIAVVGLVMLGIEESSAILLT